MKILYHHRVASKDGQYVHIEEIIKSMKKAGHEVIVVAPQLAEKQEFGGDGGFVAKLKQSLPLVVYELLEFSYSLFALIKLLKVGLYFKPDVIYERYNLYSPAGIWAKKLMNVPLILEVNAPLYQERKKYDGLGLPWLAQWSERYTWSKADHVLPVTDVLARIIIDQGVEKSRLTVLHNGINRDEFEVGKRLSSGRELINTRDKVVVGFAGFCRQWHGLEQIVEMIAQPGNEQLFFLLVGDGPARESIEKKAQALNVLDRLYITGIIERQAMPEWMDVIDIALQPDAVSYASPLKLIEYMAKGKAIVAPSQPNICELLEDKVSALLFDKGDRQTLLAAVKQLVSEPDLRKKIGLAAADAINKKSLTWDGNVSKITDISMRLIG